MRSSTVSQGTDALASQYNNLRKDAYGGSMLLVHEQSTPDMTVKVEPGVCYVGATRVIYAGGNSPSITNPVSNPRIDLICINSSGAISVVAGTENASPSAPTYPSDKLVLAEVYLRTTGTTIRDDDQGSGHYIKNDVRPFLGGGYILTESQIDSTVIASLTNSSHIYAASSGGTDAYAITLSPVPASLTNGFTVIFKADVANTGPATLNVNSLGAKAIKKTHDEDLANNDIEAGQLVIVSYQATEDVWQMQSQIANPPPGAADYGTGADGALSITSGTTNIDVGGVQIYIKNYTSISITGTGKLTFSNPHANGTLVLLLCKGNVTLTSSATPNIDVSGMGSNGSRPTSVDGATSPNGVTGGGAPIGLKSIPITCGNGGNGGGGSYFGGTPGAGGRGGGGLYIACGGAYNFTSSIYANGVNGGNGGNTGAGGGGGGGMVLVRYVTLTANSGTYSANGGNGGSAGGGGGSGGSATSGGSASGNAGVGGTRYHPDYGSGGAGGGGVAGNTGSAGSNGNGAGGGGGGGGMYLVQAAI